jgi:tetratricopeptide (TPR) repeat protein
LAIARLLGNELLEGRALDTLGYAQAFLDPPAAPAFFEQSLPLLRKHGDGWFVADALNGLGIARFFAADYAAARGALEEAVACSREIRNPNTLAVGLGVLGYTLGLLGYLPQARTSLRESLAVSRRLGDRVFSAQALYGLGFIEAHEGGHERAERRLDESVEIARDVSPLILAFALLTQGLARYIRADMAGRCLFWRSRFHYLSTCPYRG